MDDEPAPTIAVREATASDGIAASAIFDAARHQSLPFLPDLHTRDEDDAFFTGQLGDHESWLATVAGAPAGFTVFHDGLLGHLYVHPEHQGAGVGSALLTTVKDAHPEGFDLFTFQRNGRARRFYERRGFRPVAFGRDNEEDEPDVRYRWSSVP